VNKLKNKLIHFIDQFSQYSIIGLYFWLFMFRSGFIYGFFPAAIGLIKSIRELSREDGNTSVKAIYTNAFHEFKQQKWVSFLLFLFTGISLMSLYSFLFTEYPFLGFIQIPLIILTCMLWIFSVYSVYFLSQEEKKSNNIKWIYALAFDTCIRRPINSVVICLTLLALCLLIKINLIVFIFFAPPLFVMLTKRIVYIPSILLR